MDTCRCVPPLITHIVMCCGKDPWHTDCPLEEKITINSQLLLNTLLLPLLTFPRILLQRMVDSQQRVLMVSM